MTTASTTADPAALEARRAVPWSTVVPLAVVLAYADGYWVTSLRGAVGAIETTQSPFASWWRQSTLMLPVFVFAVLAAVTLAARWFGPVLRKARTVLAAGLLIVAAGTVVGLAEIVATAVYDYHLQVSQLRLMDSLHNTCPGNCLPQQQHDTIAAHGRGGLLVSPWLLLSNLVLVAWLVAMRGGRLKLTAIRRGPQGRADVQRGSTSRAADLRLLLVWTLLAIAVIHAAVVPDQFRVWAPAGAFFVLLAGAELACVGLLLARVRPPAVLRAIAVISIVALLIWLYSRIAGIPFGPRAGLPEGVGLADGAACTLEIIALLAAVILLRGTGRTGQRAPASAHVRALTAVALIAVAAIGLAGTGVGWFNEMGISVSRT
jgi:hypothetical protein